MAVFEALEHGFEALVGWVYTAFVDPVMFSLGLMSWAERAFDATGFFVAGLLYVTTMPPLWLAQVLFYGFVVTRLAHFVAYYSAQNHEVRAALWTPGSLVIIFLAGASLASAF